MGWVQPRYIDPSEQSSQMQDGKVIFLGINFYLCLGALSSDEDYIITFVNISSLEIFWNFDFLPKLFSPDFHLWSITFGTFLQVLWILGFGNKYNWQIWTNLNKQIDTFFINSF